MSCVETAKNSARHLLLQKILKIYLPSESDFLIFNGIGKLIENTGFAIC